MTFQNNFLYVYTANKSVVQFDTSIPDHYELNSSFREMAREVGFKDTMAGFAAIDGLLQKYVEGLSRSIQTMD